MTDAARTPGPRPSPPERAQAVSVRGLEKRFDRYPALTGVDLEIRPGELLALLGPSGSGKTTLLRLIAGLDFPDAGRIAFGERDVTGVPAASRGVGFVFQHYALFRHMSVARNVSFGMDVKRRRERAPAAERRAKVEELLRLVELEGLGGRYPAQLSGGQRQRVALARALAVSPRVLLLDEPFGALDATVRKSLRRELRRIHKATEVTTIFVTHDQEEALDLADRVAVLNGGRIEQLGSPEDLLERPASAFVAGFVGQPNRFAGTVTAGLFRGEGLEIAAPGVADGPALAFVRADQLEPGGSDLPKTFTLQRATRRGPSLIIECETREGRLVEVMAPPGGTLPRIGEALSLSARAGRVFPKAEAATD